VQSDAAMGNKKKRFTIVANPNNRTASKF